MQYLCILSIAVLYFNNVVMFIVSESRFELNVNEIILFALVEEGRSGVRSLPRIGKKMLTAT